MSEDFDILITGVQNYADGDDRLELQTVGQYQEKDGKTYIRYKEYDEENPNQFHRVTLEIEGEKVVMSHEESATRLVLEKGRRYLCGYDTEFGMMQLGVFTRTFSSDLAENGGELHLEYTLDVDSKLSSTNELTVTVRRR